jgi:hypothetical protein
LYVIATKSRATIPQLNRFIAAGGGTGWRNAAPY